MGRGLGGCLAAVGGVSEGGRGLRVCEGLRLGGDLLGELVVPVLWSERWRLCCILAYLFCEDEEAIRMALRSFAMNSGFNGCSRGLWCMAGLIFGGRGY